MAANVQSGPNALAVPLSLNLSAASNITLTWPSYGIGFTAETSPALGANAVWSPINVSLTLNSNQWLLTLPMTNNTTFIRLVR
jgi:hypothetical protein